MLESLFNKDAGLKVCKCIKKRLQHRYFPVPFANFLRTPFFTGHLQWLLLFTVVLQENCSEDNDSFFVSLSQYSPFLDKWLALSLYLKRPLSLVFPWRFYEWTAFFQSILMQIPLSRSRRSPTKVFCKVYIRKFCKIHREKPVMKSFFNKAGVKQLFLVSSVTFFRSAFLQQIKNSPEIWNCYCQFLLHSSFSSILFQ